MENATVDKLVRDLVRLLNDLMGLHGELAMHMVSKLEAIKRADSDQIQSITARELLLADRISEREGLRRQITKRVITGLDLNPDEHAAMKLTELAELLSEPKRSQLLVAAAGLREKLEEAQRLQVTSTLVTEQMLKHLNDVLTVMTSGGQGMDVYSQTGQRERMLSANVFEAVG